MGGLPAESATLSRHHRKAWIADRTASRTGGMAISRQNQVDRLLNSCDVGMCVDAGHLFLSGVDPLQVVKDAGDRVLHVHIKDLTNEMAEKVRSGEVPFRQATIDGMFVPAGSG